MAFRIIQPIILVAFCIAMTVSALLDTVVFEASVRNLAFVNLSKGFLQPTLTFDEHFHRSLELFDRVSVYDPARYESYHLRLKGLIETLGDDARNSGDINHLEVRPRSVAYNGWESVVGHYLRDVAQGLEAVRENAMQELAGLLDSQEEMADFGRYVYTDMSGSSSFPVTFNKCAEVDLMAIYISEWSIAIRQPVPVVIVWRITTENLQERAVLDEPFQQQDSRWEFHRSGKFLFQIGTVINKLPDGGFEQIVLPREGLPPSLPCQIYGSQLQQQTQLVYEFPETGQNMVLLLGGRRNSRVGHSRVGLCSLPIDIPSHSTREAYLVTGRYRTVGEAMPYIGIRWLLRDAQKWDDNISAYVVQRIADEWTSFAAILPSHLAAKSLEYWVINADASAQLYVDNLGLFSVSLPCH